MINFKNLSRAVLVAMAVALGLTLLGLMTAPASGAQGIDSGIIVDKIVERLGADDPGEFIITVTSSVSGPVEITNVVHGTVWFDEFIAGAEETFTISEAAAAGTNAADYQTTIACSLNGGLPILTEAPLADSPSVSVTVPSTQLAVCTITNTNINPPRPRLTIIKATVPASDPQDFEFEITRPSPDRVITPTLDTDLDNTPPVRSNNTTVIGEPGFWSFQEFPTTGWDFGGVSCVDQDGNGFTTNSRDGDEAHRDVALAYGDDITCTFTNIKQTGTLTIAKETLPAGDPAQFTFSIDGTVYGPISGGQQTGPIVVPVGELTIFEGTPSGWVPTDFSCALADGGAVVHSQDAGDPDEGTVTIPPGGDVVCTYTNTKLGSITIAKQTLPDADPTLFEFVGAPLFGGSIGDGQTIFRPNVTPGSYTFTETVPAGWALTDISCDDDNSSGDTGTGVATITLEAGENVTCTFTNTKRTGTLRIAKETLPDGDSQPFSFIVDDFDEPIEPEPISDGQQTTSIVVPAREIQILEQPTPGWVATDFSCELEDGGDVDHRQDLATFGPLIGFVTIPPGGDVVCTYSNSKRGSITLAKQTVPADPDFTDFEIIDFDTDEFITFLTDGAELPLLDVLPGVDLRFQEVAQDGWALTDIDCNGTNSSGDIDTGVATVNLEPGEDVVCTYTNTKLATVTIAKETLPDGDLTPFVFTGTGGGGDGLVTSLADGGSETVMLPPNVEYQVSEAVVDGWTLSDLTCIADGTSATSTEGPVATFTPAPGDNITCTFTNTKLATITVEKVTVPGGDGARFDFTGPDGAFTLGDVETITFEVLPGEHTITELASDGWMLTGATCGDLATPPVPADGSITVTAEAGESVFCQFTNTKIESCANGSINPCLTLEDPYVCGQGFTGTIGDGTAPYTLVYSLAPTGGFFTTLPGFPVAAAGDYATPDGYIDHDVFDGPHTIEVTVTDADGNTAMVSFEATLTTDCTEPEPEPTAVTPTRTVSFIPGIDDAQTQTLLAAIRNLDSADAVAADSASSPAAAAAPAPAPATADRPLAVTGASSSLLAMFGLAAIGSGAYVHGTRRLRRDNT